MGAGDLNSDLVCLLAPPNDFLFTFSYSEKLVLNMLPHPDPATLCGTKWLNPGY